MAKTKAPKEAKEKEPAVPAAAQKPLEGKTPGLVAKTPGLNVFEFGSAQAAARPEGGGGDAATLVGFCPISDELEACQWEVLPAAGKQAPRFRIVF